MPVRPHANAIQGSVLGAPRRDPALVEQEGLLHAPGAGASRAVREASDAHPSLASNRRTVWRPARRPGSIESKADVNRAMMTDFTLIQSFEVFLASISIYSTGARQSLCSSNNGFYV